MRSLFARATLAFDDLSLNARKPLPFCFTSLVNNKIFAENTVDVGSDSEVGTFKLATLQLQSQTYLIFIGP